MKRFVLAVLLLVVGMGRAAAQGPNPVGSGAARAGADDPLKVFLDCKDHTPCFSDYVKTEIGYVDYVNVREAAQVHVLVTSLGTGAGGRQFTLKFVGLDAFKGVEDEILFSTLATDTEDVMRREFVRTLKLGLVRYALHTGVGSELHITHQPQAAVARAKAQPTRDPWNRWVMRARVNGSFESESSSDSNSTNLSASANRTTDMWKLGGSAFVDTRVSNYTFSDGSSYRSTRDSYDVTVQAIRSVSRHWSAGAKAFISASTYENKDRVLNATAAVEYNFFPYTESTRRQLTLQYLLGLTDFDYDEETVYGKLSETVGLHTFRASYDVKQTWGSLSADFDWSQYMHDSSMKRRSLSVEADVRLFKGFALTINGRTSSIHDQLYLPKGDATDEEVLARQRQLATSYRRSLRVGVSYTFGSIFSNVVNTRLGNLVGGGGGMW